MMKRIISYFFATLVCATLCAQRPSRGEALLSKGKTQWKEYCVRMGSHNLDDMIAVLSDAVEALKGENKDEQMCEACLTLCDLYAKDYRYHEAAMFLLEKVREFSPDPASPSHIQATLLLSNLYYHYSPDKSTRLFTSIDRHHVEALSNHNDIVVAYLGRGIMQGLLLNQTKEAAYLAADLCRLDLEQMKGHERVQLLRAIISYVSLALDESDFKGIDTFIQACQTVIKDYHLEESAAMFPLKYVMAKYLLRTGRADLACKHLEDIILPVADRLGPLSMEAVECSLLYSDASMAAGRPDMAIQLLNTYLDVFKRNLGLDNYPYYRIGTNLAKTYYLKRDYAAAARVFEGSAAWAISHRYDLLAVYPFLAMVRSKAGRTREALEAGEDAVALLRSSLHDTFLLIPDSSRRSIWSGSLFNLVNGTSNAIDPASDRKGILYDLALLSKGVLCESKKQFAEIVRKSPTPQLESAWRTCAELQWQVEDLYASPTLDYPAIRKAEGKLAGAESTLMAVGQSAGIKELYWGDCSWQKVSQALRSHEAAVEYLRYRDSETGSYRYIASVLRPGAEPVNVRLKDVDEKALKEMPRKRICDPETLYGLFLRPVAHLLSGADMVYFSPVGVINGLPLESVISKVRLRRLSSTRELLPKGGKSRWSSAVLFGGLDYNLGLEEMEYYAEASSERSGTARDAEWTALRGSREEVQNAYNLLTIPDKRLLTGGEGVEESFKSLSGKGFSLIHIATHGFFDAEDPSASHLAEEDRAMYNSGLVFAGANNHVTPGPGMDDGLLSAIEISRLDLSGCDLAVLSACGTGRIATDRTNDVYGLVRAFKNAGCRSILVTLWEVDDKATVLLMDTFYRGLLSGMDKVSALSAAREATRKRYPDPTVWAPFILID